MLFESSTSRWAVLGVANIPLYLVVGSAFFGSWENFFDCIGYWFKPDLLSALQGEWAEDFWAEFKLGVFLTLCTVVLYGEYHYFFGSRVPARDTTRPKTVSYRPAPRHAEQFKTVML